MASPAQAAALEFVFLPFGLMQWQYAESFARFDEQIDAIGSNRSWSGVEAADWKVLLTKYTGITSLPSPPSPFSGGWPRCCSGDVRRIQSDATGDSGETAIPKGLTVGPANRSST